MKKCEQCGEYNGSDAKKCFKCGAPVKWRDGERVEIPKAKNHNALWVVAFIFLFLSVAAGVIFAFTRESDLDRVAREASEIEIKVDREKVDELKRIIDETQEKYRKETVP